MAFKLTKDEIARRDEHVSRLREAASTLDDAVRVYNEGLAALRSNLESAVSTYNLTLLNAAEWADDIAQQALSEIEDRSEQWQASERGEAASEWQQTWEEFDPEEIEVEFPDDLDIAAPEHADDLEQLPEQME